MPRTHEVQVRLMDGPEMRAALDAAREQIECLRVERAALCKPLVFLAERDNWLGDPLDQTSTLHGHFTPFELARAALGEASDA